MRRGALALAAAALAACTDPVAPPVPAQLEVLRGPTAISVPGHRYDTISVRLTGSRGESVVGWPITWSGDGEVVPLDSVTDDVGIARAQWTLPRSGIALYGPYFNGPSGRYDVQVSALGFEDRVLSTEARAFTADRIDAAMGYGCGLRGAELWCWGRSAGLGFHSRYPVQMELPISTVPSGFRTGEEILCILDGARRPWCRGRASNQQWQRIANAPPLLDLETVEPEYQGTMCGRAVTDQRIWCWSQIGPDALIAASVSDRSFSSLDGGWGIGCALDLEGKAWCRGHNEFGQLGTGDFISRDTLVPVAGGHTFERITAGFQLTCGSDLDHMIWCWGSIGPDGPAPVPVAITLPWVRGPWVVAGDWREMYVMHEGRIRGWYRGAEVSAISSAFAEHDVVEVAGYGAWCIRVRSGEVHCGISVLHWISDVFFPVHLVPIPDPASQVNP